MKKNVKNKEIKTVFLENVQELHTLTSTTSNFLYNYITTSNTIILIF